MRFNLATDINRIFTLAWWAIFISQDNKMGGKKNNDGMVPGSGWLTVQDSAWIHQYAWDFLVHVRDGPRFVFRFCYRPHEGDRVNNKTTPMQNNLLGAIVALINSHCG